MALSTPATREQLLDFLSNLDITTKTHDHEAVFTVAESHKIKEDYPVDTPRTCF